MNHVDPSVSSGTSPTVVSMMPPRVPLSASSQLFVKIEKREAVALITKHHYLHRKCPISYAWGVKVGEEIKGVLTIGKPASWSTSCGLVGETKVDLKNPAARTHDVFELNRLWMHDDLPRNSESRFVAWCLRELRKENPDAILVSYADGEQGHVGYVYQATNFTYLGQSAEFEDITVDGYVDYRSVPEGARGGVIFKCDRDGVFEGPLPCKAKGKNADLPDVPTQLPCPKCGELAKKLRSRAWAFIREADGVLKERGNKKVWTHTTVNGKAHTMRLKSRSRKHQYVWFADKRDEKLLPKKYWSSEVRIGFPYPKRAAA